MELDDGPEWPSGEPQPVPRPESQDIDRRLGLPVLPVVVLVAVLLAAMVGLVGWGRSNQSSARQWRDRGELDHSRLATQVEAAKSAETTATETRTKLATLAARLANVTDRETILQDVLKGAPALNAALQKCSAATGAIDPRNRGTVDAATRECAAAQTEATALQRVVDSLGL